MSMSTIWRENRIGINLITSTFSTPELIMWLRVNPKLSLLSLSWSQISWVSALERRDLTWGPNSGLLLESYLYFAISSGGSPRARYLSFCSFSLCCSISFFSSWINSFTPSYMSFTSWTSLNPSLLLLEMSKTPSSLSECSPWTPLIWTWFLSAISYIFFLSFESSGILMCTLALKPVPRFEGQLLFFFIKYFWLSWVNN